MKNFLREKIKGFLGLTAAQNSQKNARIVMNDLQSLHLINQHFPIDHYFPLTSFSINPTTVLHVINDTLINKRKKIVELGSGFSTLVIASFLRKADAEIQFISIEHDGHWLEQVQKMLNRNDLTNYVKLVHVPLRERQIDNKLKIWYDTEIIDSVFASTIDKIDLLLVDGPPAYLDLKIRESALPAFIKHMAGSFSVFLDDTNRNSESMIASVWAAKFNIKATFYLRYTCLSTDAGFVSDPISLVDVF